MSSLGLTFLLMLSTLTSSSLAADCVAAGVLTERTVWNKGISVDVTLTFPESVTGWMLQVTFDRPLTGLDTWVATASTSDQQVYTLTNKSHNGQQAAGSQLMVAFNAYFTSRAMVTSLLLNGAELCTAAATTTAPAATSTTAPTVTSKGGDCIAAGIIRENTVWNAGMNAEVDIPFSQSVTSWSVQIVFDSKLTSFKTWIADFSTSDSMTYTLVNKDHNGVQQAGNQLAVPFNAYFTSKANVVSVKLNGQELCSGTATTSTSASTSGTTPSTTSGSTPPPPSETTASGTTSSTTNAPPTKGSTVPPGNLAYDYNDVIQKSLLFYEAQRSGRLPAHNRISYRGDSALTDGQDVGLDLTGGYYDAGDHVKFGLPMASMTTLLAWGALNFADGYDAAGQSDYLKEAVRWATDYFIKCHPSTYEFYGQVGNGHTDHAWWGRPEEMTMERPAYKITAESPGSELAGETAAALAAASVLFSDADPAYSATLLQHARELYDFADTYRGEYHKAITDAADFYFSHSGYGDELTWAAAWLHRATGEPAYLQAAEQHFQQFQLGYRPSEFAWDGKVAGAQLMLYNLTGQQQYGQLVSEFCDWLVSGAPRTPKGLLHLQAWGSLRHAANAAFICLQAAEAGLSPATYRQLAKQQIHYMLGDSGRSFVVGFGTNPPQRPHHKASSCPDLPAPCSWDQLNTAEPNPQVLIGALVGGPADDDSYVDSRTDFVHNEVACDYNAGFQSAVAALNALRVRGQYPN